MDRHINENVSPDNKFVIMFMDMTIINKSQSLDMNLIDKELR